MTLLPVHQQNGPDATSAIKKSLVRIAWIQENPAFSTWLKTALQSATVLDPVAVMNDLEILHHLLEAWAAASIELERTTAESPTSSAGSVGRASVE